MVTVELDRKAYIGGSDARTILGTDENALIRLWKEKRGELEPEDLSGSLLVQFGCATEGLNRRPEVQNGSRSKWRPTRCTRLCCFRLSGSSGAASRPAKCPACSARSRQRRSCRSSAS